MKQCREGAHAADAPIPKTLKPSRRGDDISGLTQYACFVFVPIFMGNAIHGELRKQPSFHLSLDFLVNAVA